MARAGDEEREAFSSNAVRLSPREWCLVLALLGVFALLVGRVWERVERFEPGPDFRIPYGLSEDYWLFQRYCSDRSREGKGLVFGDSFVWGQYVDRERTLTHFLNERAGEARFANMGLDGAHPLALKGLLQHHCPRTRGGSLILHLNLLWLSSPQADLQVGGEGRINHPTLLPQVFPRIPAHRGSASTRIGTAVERRLPLFDWVRHLKAMAFGGSDLARWGLENPYRNPLGSISLNPGVYDADTHPESEPWISGGASRRSLPWVELEASIQWRAFLDLVRDLEARGDRVLVLIGPLNEHMLAQDALVTYREILRGVERRLRAEDVPYVAPPTLPSELYADLSHPLGEGYALLAERVWGWLVE